MGTEVDGEGDAVLTPQTGAKNVSIPQTKGDPVLEGRGPQTSKVYWGKGASLTQEQKTMDGQPHNPPMRALCVCGFAVGFLGLFGGVILGTQVRRMLRKEPFSGGNDPGVGLSMMPMVTAPGAAVLSGGACAVSLFLDYDRWLVCGQLNIAMLSVLALLAISNYLW
eukprot:2893730-Rhodomonas_salina.1